jgi:hypothetical protein
MLTEFFYTIEVINAQVAVIFSVFNTCILLFNFWPLMTACAFAVSIWDEIGFHKDHMCDFSLILGVQVLLKLTCFGELYITEFAI